MLPSLWDTTVATFIMMIILNFQQLCQIAVRICIDLSKIILQFFFATSLERGIVVALSERNPQLSNIDFNGSSDFSNYPFCSEELELYCQSSYKSAVEY